jgi:CHC2 zinc finger
MSSILEAKRKLPLPVLMNQLGLGEHARKSARCPFHEDKRNSFSIWRNDKGEHHFKCHAGCGAGDEINLLELHKSISRSDATKLFLEMAGANGCTPHTPKPNQKQTTNPCNWQACVDAFTAEHLEGLAKWRGYSLKFCHWLHQSAIVGLYSDGVAFPIHDSGKVVAAHYRLKDGSWRVFPLSSRMRPLVIGDIANAKVVNVFESQWDAFAVADKLALYEKEDIALIITRGAGNGALVSGLIPPEAIVFAWKQNDQLKGGKRVGGEWLKAVTAHSPATVQVATTPERFKDANDWTKAGATVDELESALDRAEVIHMLPIGNNLPKENYADKANTADSYFDAGRKEYWTPNNRGGWINLNETQFKRILKQRGISPKIPEGTYVSPLDEQLIEIQQTCDVHYAGALAGHGAGVYDMGERRILVTESPRIIQTVSGAWPTLRAVIDGLLGDPQFDQRPYLFGWLKVSFETLQAGERRPGQALVLAGEHGCGKSLLQNLITLMIGGRSARPYQFMSGLTSFNSDLFEAEHLMIEDEQASTDIRARRNFGAQLKNIAVVDWQRCHAKNRVAISLAPFWRLSVTVNDEPENLMVLPPIDDSIEDKLIILRASKFPMPMPTVTLEQRKQFWQTLEGELPGFLYYLTHWNIPGELSSERFGVAHFHHPEILRAIDDLAPEFRLLRLIDDDLFQSAAAGSWEGSAEQLERELSGEESRCRNEARKLFTFNTACGVYLGRLAKRRPDRFSGEHTRRGNQWTITPPKL